MELQHYVKILRKKMGWIISFILIAVIVAGFATERYVPARYESSIKLVMGLYGEDRDLEYGNVNANILMMTTYKEFLKSQTVLNQVILDYPDLELSKKELDNNLRVSSNKDSQIISLSFTSDSADRSNKAVRAVAVVFERLVSIHLKTDLSGILPQVDVSGQEAEPSSSLIMNIILAFLASSFISVGLIIFREVLDTTLKSPREVEEILGVGPLALIAKPSKRNLKRSVAKRVTRQMGETKYAKG